MSPKAFITNQQQKTLKRRLISLMEHSSTLKFLTGFFYFSGWPQLYEGLKDRDDITVKILVGLDVDRKLFRSMEVARDLTKLSKYDKAEEFFDSLVNAVNSEELDIEEFYRQVEFFVKLIREDKLLIRKTLEPNHAKLYLFKAKAELGDGWGGCKFITGSSNLTRAGIAEQNEFNVEIGDYGTDEAEEYFDELWKTAVKITEEPRRKKDLIDIIKNRSQAATVTPFEAYVKLLKTYLDIQEQKTVEPYVQRLLEKNGYKSYSYQKDAVNQALTILENYHGVIVADVVGLGKSVIASMIGKQLGTRGVVICPPGLIDDDAESGWNMYFEHFDLTHWRLFSCGDLERAVKYIRDHGEGIDTVIVDEAHRFRNQDTQSYELLSSICQGRQVILMTATPFNNTPADIFALLKLFDVPGQSKIILEEDMEARFSHYDRLFRDLSYIRKNHDSADPEKRRKSDNKYERIFGDLPIDLHKVQQRTHHLSQEIRAVIEPVVIRRNRLDLKRDPVYSREVTELSETNDPEELYFELTPEQSKFYDTVVNDYFGENGDFKGAIYQPFSYEQKWEMDEDEVEDKDPRKFQIQQQRNLYEFMRRLLVKRFESSFGSFEQSIRNFIRIHERVKIFIEKTGRYILDRKLIETIYNEDEEHIDQALEEFAEKLEEEEQGENERIYYVGEFEEENRFLADIESDLSLFHLVLDRVEELNLVDNDPKAETLVAELSKILSKTPEENEPSRKVIVFSEYVDTVEHLRPFLEGEFGDRVLSVEGTLSKGKSHKLLSNFDARFNDSEKDDDYDILLASDKLAEGYNLNRAGAIINYDIPWNPTRVIQRVGRINRIGNKVFSNLYIYNFFPTETGADIVKNRMIAEQKLYLIHNTLGEDSKIFAPEEKPTESELFKRINTNPEEQEVESITTSVRRRYKAIEREHPEVIERVSKLPARIKTAKGSDAYNLLVFRRKALGLFIHSCPGMAKGDDDSIEQLMFEDALPWIECGETEPKLELSDRFWANYEALKVYRPTYRKSVNENSLEVKARNNLMTAQKLYKTKLLDEMPFIRKLIEVLRDYYTLPKFSLRRLCEHEMGENASESDIDKFRSEINYLRNHLGPDFLDVIKERVKGNYQEIIISVENQVKELLSQRVANE